MPNYDWRAYQERPLSERFPEWAIGYGLVREFGGAASSLTLLLDSLVQARSSAAAAANRPQRPRVFVSHRAADVVKAERLAWLADQAGFEFWLDVLDSNLLSIGRAAAAGVVSPATQAQLVACVIEMALLNSTHVLVTMTPNTSGSAWVPYELGRAKDAAVYATQASAWVSTTPPVPSLPEYLLLIPQNDSEPAVEAWLDSEYSAWCGTPSPGDAGGWQGKVPKPL